MFHRVFAETVIRTTYFLMSVFVKTLKLKPEILREIDCNCNTEDLLDFIFSSNQSLKHFDGLHVFFVKLTSKVNSIKKFHKKTVYYVTI